MLKKRLIGVVTVKNSWAVQSFGYRRYLPLGKPECLIENLDRWGADEILVQVIDRSVSATGPDYEMLDRIARLGLGTPLIYGGGIRNTDDGVQVIQRGADRIVVDSILHDDLSVAMDLSDRLGAQALIASIPMMASPSGPEWFDYRQKNATSLGAELSIAIEQNTFSEILLTDCRNEGIQGGFDCALIEQFPFSKAPLIAFGGINSVTQMKDLLARPNVVAVSVGNFLNYREHAIQQFKVMLQSAALRQPTYATEYSLLADGE